MNLQVAVFITLLISLSVPYDSLAQVAAPLSKVVMTIGAISEREGVVYVAHDQGFFRKHGLDLTLVQVRSGGIGIAAVSAGESHVHWGSVSAANIGAIAEGADLVFLAGFINKLTGTFVVNPKIKTPADLKGKSIGVNALSGGAWIFAMLTLDYWGLVPERDNIQFRALGDQGVIAQGLSAGAVDAAFLGYTFGKALEAKGFRILADAEKLPIPYQGSGIMARRSFSLASPAIIENVLRGLLDSLVFIRDPTNKDRVMKSLAKGLRLKRVEEAEEGYQIMLGLYEKKIYPSVDGIRNVIRLLGKNNDKIRRLKAEDLIYDSFVKKLEKEGRF